MQWQFGEYEVDTDRDRIDIARVHAFLSTTYWSSDRSLDEVTAAWSNSQVVFGVYFGGELVGCARVLTDTRVFGWLADVFITPEHRGKGVGKFLVARITEHPDCGNLRLFILGTRDAHGLYEQFGWGSPTYPERFMVRCAPVT